VKWFVVLPQTLQKAWCCLVHTLFVLVLQELRAMSRAVLPLMLTVLRVRVSCLADLRLGHGDRDRVRDRVGAEPVRGGHTEREPAGLGRCSGQDSCGGIQG